MEADFWHQRWQANQIGFHSPEVHRFLPQYLPDLGLSPDDTVFVPLCGKSLDMRWLLEQGYQVQGVELSPLAVRAFFEEHGMHARVDEHGEYQRWRAEGAELFCGDLFHMNPEQVTEVKAVYDRAALIALPADMRRDYVEYMYRVLPAATAVLLVTLDYDQALMNGPPFAVAEAEVRELYEPHARVTVLESLDILDDEPRFKERGLQRLVETVYRIDV